MPHQASRAHAVKGSHARKGKSKRSGNRIKSGSPTFIPSQKDIVVERQLPGFMLPRYRAKLRYFEPAVGLSSGAGTVGSYIFSANGMYDPDVTSTGHQPMPFDQLMLSFEHYTVVRSKIMVQFRSNENTLPVDVCLSVNANNVSATSIIALNENGLLLRDRLPPIPYSGHIKTLAIGTDIAKFQGVPNIMDAEELRGSLTSNPTEQTYFHVGIWNALSAAVVSVTAEVTIEYEAWFTEPRQNTPSVSLALKKLIISEEKCKAVVH